MTALSAAPDAQNLVEQVRERTQRRVDEAIIATRQLPAPPGAENRRRARLTIGEINDMAEAAIRDGVSPVDAGDDRSPLIRFLDLVDLPRNTVANTIFGDATTGQRIGGIGATAAAGALFGSFGGPLGALAGAGVGAGAGALAQLAGEVFVGDERQRQITLASERRGAFAQPVIFGSDVLKALGVENRVVRAVVGFGGDIALDPLTYLSGGGNVVTWSTRAGTRIRVARPAVKILDDIERSITQTGRLPTGAQYEPWIGAFRDGVLVGDELVDVSGASGDIAGDILRALERTGALPAATAKAKRARIRNVLIDTLTTRGLAETATTGLNRAVPVVGLDDPAAIAARAFFRRYAAVSDRQFTFPFFGILGNALRRPLDVPIGRLGRAGEFRRALGRSEGEFAERLIAQRERLLRDASETQARQVAAPSALAVREIEQALPEELVKAELAGIEAAIDANQSAQRLHAFDAGAVQRTLAGMDDMLATFRRGDGATALLGPAAALRAVDRVIPWGHRDLMETLEQQARTALVYDTETRALLVQRGKILTAITDIDDEILGIHEQLGRSAEELAEVINRLDDQITRLDIDVANELKARKAYEKLYERLLRRRAERASVFQTDRLALQRADARVKALEAARLDLVGQHARVRLMDDAAQRGFREVGDALAAQRAEIESRTLVRLWRSMVRVEDDLRARVGLRTRNTAVREPLRRWAIRGETDLAARQLEVADRFEREIRELSERFPDVETGDLATLILARIAMAAQADGVRGFQPEGVTGFSVLMDEIIPAAAARVGQSRLDEILEDPIVVEVADRYLTTTREFHAIEQALFPVPEFSDDVARLYLPIRFSEEAGAAFRAAATVHRGQHTEAVAGRLLPDEPFTITRNTNRRFFHNEATGEMDWVFEGELQRPLSDLSIEQRARRSLFERYVAGQRAERGDESWLPDSYPTDPWELNKHRSRFHELVPIEAGANVFETNLQQIMVRRTGEHYRAINNARLKADLRASGSAIPSEDVQFFPRDPARPSTNIMVDGVSYRQLKPTLVRDSELRVMDEEAATWFYPEALAGEIEDFAKRFRTSRDVHGVLAGLDKVQSFWKFFALLHPSYWLVNLTGNAIMSYARGQSRPAFWGQHVMRYGNLVRKMHFGGLDRLSTKKLIEFGGELRTERALGELFLLNGAVNPNRATIDWISTGRVGGAEVVAKFAKGNPLSRATAWWWRANAASDDLFRVITLADRIEQGDGFEPALRAMVLAHFDYGDLSTWEQTIGTRVWPFMRWCVTDDCECLTAQGWKRVDDLAVGDAAYSLNMTTGMLEMDVIEDIAVFPARDEEMVRVTGRRGRDFEMTPDHRCVVRDTYKPDLLRIRLAKDLKTQDRIVRGRPFAFPTESALSPRDAAILGWVVTDGYARRRSRTPGGREYDEWMIYQSPKKHLDAIVELLGDEGKVRKPHPGTGVVCVAVRQAAIRRIRAVLSEPRDFLSILHRLSREAAEAMFQAMMDAEGSVDRRNLTPVGKFVQAEGPVLDGFQVLCLMLGRTVDIHACHARAGRFGPARQPMGHVYVPEQGRDWKIVDATIERSRYTGRVWCPVTRNGTWVMRRNGHVCVTGNTRNNIAAQVSLLMKRPAFAASFPKLQKALETALVDEDRVPDELRPRWMKDNVATQIWASDNGEAKFLLLSLFTPAQEIYELGQSVFGAEGFVEGVKYLVSSTSPLAKMPFELAAGQEFFTGREIGEFKELGVSDYLAQQFRPYREVASAKRLLKKEHFGAPDLTLRFLIGGRLQQTDVETLERRTAWEAGETTQMMRQRLRLLVEREQPEEAQTLAVRLVEKYRRLWRLGMTDLVPVRLKAKFIEEELGGRPVRIAKGS